MKIELLKFGGNSFKDESSYNIVIEIIKAKLADDILPVVVVSAMGRKGNPYSTDNLIELSPKSFEADHDMDLLQASGELISAAVLSLRLKSQQVKSKSLSSYECGIVTTKSHQKARVISVDTSKIRYLLNERILPIIPGFQGVTATGETTTLGRGGSDTTAAVLGAALELDKIEIYTDVDGVFSADPRIVTTASLLENLDFQEAFEFAAHGAKVIHPRAAEIASNNRMSVHIKPLNSSGNQTVIHKIKSDKPITGIAVKNDIVHVTIKSNTLEESQRNLDVFDLLAKNAISVDYIAVANYNIAFVIDEKDSVKMGEILGEYDYSFAVDKDRAMISIIGAGMTGIPGIMARIVNALKKHGISIYQTTDSHTSISCLLKRVDSEEAVCILHSEFDL